MGASRADVAGSVARHGLLIAGIGIAAGGVLSYVFGGLLRAKIASVAPGDPLIAAGAAAILLAATAFASWIPARNAVRVDLAAALRTD